MSERRYIRIEAGKQEDCSPADAAAAVRAVLAKGTGISHDAVLTMERAAEALEHAAQAQKDAPKPTKK